MLTLMLLFEYKGEGIMNRQTDNPNVRCLRQTFQTRGHKKFKQIECYSSKWSNIVVKFNTMINDLSLGTGEN